MRAKVFLLILIALKRLKCKTNIMRKLKILPIVLIMLLGLLQYRLWFEPGGIIEMMRMKKQLTVEAQKNEQLKKRNQELLKQVQYLHKNSDSIEGHARRELGMVKRGEVYYQVIKRSNSREQTEID